MQNLNDQVDEIFQDEKLSKYFKIDKAQQKADALAVPE